MINVQKSVISLSNGKNIAIVHNLNWFGVTISSTLELWLNETNDYSAESFCTYIKKLDSRYIALTLEEYYVLKNTGK